jgi:hypothetical protein
MRDPLPAAREPRPRGGRLAAVLGVLAVTWLVGEVALHFAVRRDEDGQEWLLDVRLRPYQLPLRRIGETIDHLEHDPCFLAYDPDLGWAPRPGARSRDGLQRVDAGGIRTDAEITVVPRPDVLRVALFGDSFTFGDEVALDDTWGAALERGLAARGVPAEVLNFGVNAYGTDQAYLRWQRSGRQYRPAVVVLGFQPEDVLRNLNVFRPLYFMGSEVPLSKPRFVVRDDALALVNQPTVPLDRLRDALAALPTEPALAYERYFVFHETPWWLRTRMTAALATFVANARNDPFQLSDEARDLANRIVAAFAADVRTEGAAFVIVHLPRRDDLRLIAARRPLWYDPLLRDLEAQHTLVRPESAMAADDDASWAPHGHYAGRSNEVVGAALVGAVLAAAPPTLSARRAAR